MEKKERLGFVGLGSVGRVMARNLLNVIGAEAEVRIFDEHEREEDVAPLVALGASRVLRLAEVGEPGGIVFSLVPDDLALLRIALGNGGLLYQLGVGGIHLSLSTPSPDVAIQLAKMYAYRGSTFVAAPVLGCPDGADQADVALLLAGEASAKRRVRPYLVAMARHIYDLGKRVEAASMASLASTYLIAAAIEAMGEAVALMEGYGFDRAQFLDVLVASSLFAGRIFEEYGQMIGAREYCATMFPVAQGLKTVELVAKTSKRIGVPLLSIEAILAHLRAAPGAGRAAEDRSALNEFARRPSGQEDGGLCM